MSNEPLSRRVTVSRCHGAGRAPRMGLARGGGEGRPGAARGCAGGRLWGASPSYPAPPPTHTPPVTPLPGRAAPAAPAAAGETAGVEPGRGSVVVTWRGSRGGGVGPSRSRRSGSGERRSREGGRESGREAGRRAGLGRARGGSPGVRVAVARSAAAPRRGECGGRGGSGQGRRAGAPPGAGWAGRCAGPGAAPGLFSFCSGGHLCAGREVRFFGVGGLSRGAAGTCASVVCRAPRPFCGGCPARLRGARPG